ncbi:hypothetical protein GBBBJNDB_00391 [Pseudomonas phage Callisto]|uniref:Baseplate wedge n=1 Tax=Pseudomonas phage vB_PaeM_PA5oct TaxID=2163605 RepID=A0A4Y5JV55_9CAUD|nr:baseplate wedge subunit [Pseudomonas phage vB_PaeM_PA5oct]QCG76011.1 baseplate wedge [Pseudomonas phage vB_PaeM_PA5oct]WMI32082.1 hypothetical protein GBBBJNDB_00391 [Pseudomonas phage Callisto]WPK40153.1 baseplate wedge subunit [Pseudomonas phage Ettore]
MSQDVRQSNLFAAEDYRKIYKSFKDVDFKAYDFDSLKTALVNYVQIHYPEDFNDYIESSEFIAIIELLAYLGTSLAFRMDLNSRENFMDTAERRDSIIRLARMINYQPKRNIPAKGLFKLIGVQTSEPVTDSQERNLNNRTVFWNDPNDIDSYDKFITILNAAFASTNPFGRPFKSGTVGNIPTSLYQLNNVKRVNVAFPIPIVVNNVALPFEVVNSDFDETFTERQPDPDDAFHVIYRNDGQGLDSANTGFFLQFKQGTLAFKDFAFDFPVQNRIIDINDRNINETDVWVQEINEIGTVEEKWTKVPNVSGGTNIIYNSINLGIRNIFEVVSRVNDQISVKFSDGNFGTIPTGTFRVWYRVSSNTTFTLRPEEASGMELVIPYIGADSQQYDLRLIFSLEQTISNSSPTETNDEIKTRAPQVYYTQDRMVNNEDYNVFPLTQGSSIAKVHAINRTHSGHSRYIDINDPTGFHQNLNIFGEDGSIYNQSTVPSTTVAMGDKLVSENIVVRNNLQTFIRNQDLINFYWNNYLSEYIRYRQNPTPNPINTSIVRPGVPNIFRYTSTQAKWVTYPSSDATNTGYLVKGSTNYIYPTNYNNRPEGEFRFLSVGSKIKFTNGTEYKEVTVKSITNPVSQGDATTDNEFIATRLNASLFVFDIEIPANWYVDSVYPRYKTTFDTEETTDIANQLFRRNEFGLKYDIDVDPEGSWFIVLGVPTTNLDNFEFDLSLSQPAVRKDWMLVLTYSTETDNYTFLSRGTKFIFETNGTVEFYYDTDETEFDINTGSAQRDEIEILGINTGPTIVENWQFIGNGQWRLVNGIVSLTYPDNKIILKYRDTLPKEIQYWQNGILLPGALPTGAASAGVLDAEYVGQQVNDIIRIFYSNQGQLGNSIVWNSFQTFIESDGYSDPRKIVVVPADRDRDGIPDNTFIFEQFVSPTDLVFHEKTTDYDGYEYNRLWQASWLDLRQQNPNSLDFNYNDVVARDLVLIASAAESSFKSLLRTKVLEAIYSDNYNSNNSVDGTTIFIERIENDGINIVTQNLDSPGSRIFETIRINNGNNQTINEITGITAAKANSSSLAQFMTLTASYAVLSYVFDDDHSVSNGRGYTQNEDSQFYPLHYKWKHYAPSDNRIDPSISNIVDMVTLTQSYYDDILKWKNQNLPIERFPESPTTEELRIQFGDLSTYKMLSDQIVFQPARFKVLFGQQAREEYKCTFKVVKVGSTTLTDNEIKSKVVSAIDEYFNINNWDFGESFYYTELAAYIHQTLAGVIGSVVIVPIEQTSKFGNLFQIRAESDELFISTATVANVEIVNNLTEMNMRI